MALKHPLQDCMRDVTISFLQVQETHEGWFGKPPLTLQSPRKNLCPVFHSDNMIHIALIWASAMRKPLLFNPKSISFDLEKILQVFPLTPDYIPCWSHQCSIITGLIKYTCGFNMLCNWELAPVTVHLLFLNPLHILQIANLGTSSRS